MSNILEKNIVYNTHTNKYTFEEFLKTLDTNTIYIISITENDYSCEIRFFKDDKFNYRLYTRIYLETNTNSKLEEITMFMQNPQPISLSKHNIIVALKNVFQGRVKCIHLFNIVSVITKNKKIKKIGNSKRPINTIQDILSENLNQDIHTYVKNLFNEIIFKTPKVILACGQHIFYQPYIKARDIYKEYLEDFCTCNDNIKLLSNVKTKISLKEYGLECYPACYINKSEHNKHLLEILDSSNMNYNAC